MIWLGRIVVFACVLAATAIVDAIGVLLVRMPGTGFVVTFVGKVMIIAAFWGTWKMLMVAWG